MLPSWKRCFTAADVFLLVAAAFSIRLQSAPASLSATCKYTPLDITVHRISVLLLDHQLGV